MATRTGQHGLYLMPLKICSLQARQRVEVRSRSRDKLVARIDRQSTSRLKENSSRDARQPAHAQRRHQSRAAGLRSIVGAVAVAVVAVAAVGRSRTPTGRQTADNNATRAICD
jgi:hypothetical protein